MNERIRELLVKAGVINNNFNPLAYEQWYLDSLEKFAEMIVRECVDIAVKQKQWVENQEVFNPNDEQWNRARIQQSQHIADRIRLHFGVSE